MPRLTQSVFDIPKMDCPSEERMIRMALQGVDGIALLSFDLAGRQMTARHHGPVQVLLQRLEPLGLGTRLAASSPCTEPADAATPGAASAADSAAAEARVLKLLLAINALMFAAEIGVGFWAQSTGLIADSLDMLADAAVYGLALYAVGRSDAWKTRAAHLAGWLQMGLALMTGAEVLRSFFWGSEPVSALMMAMGGVALIANASCLVLIARQRHGGAHMKASYIFSSNDVIANAGVILAGALVAWTGSRHPDLVIGLVITGVVMNGARRILRLR